jgi:hypothetical protein
MWCQVKTCFLLLRWCLIATPSREDEHFFLIRWKGQKGPANFLKSFYKGTNPVHKGSAWYHEEIKSQYMNFRGTHTFNLEQILWYFTVLVFHPYLCFACLLACMLFYLFFLYRIHEGILKTVYSILTFLLFDLFLGNSSKPTFLTNISGPWSSQVNTDRPDLSSDLSTNTHNFHHYISNWISWRHPSLKIYKTELIIYT